MDRMEGRGLRTGGGVILCLLMTQHGGTKEFWENERPLNPPAPPAPPPPPSPPDTAASSSPSSHTHTVAADGVYLAQIKATCLVQKQTLMQTQSRPQGIMGKTSS